MEGYLRCRILEIDSAIGKESANLGLFFLWDVVVTEFKCRELCEVLYFLRERCELIGLEVKCRELCEVLYLLW